MYMFKQLVGSENLAFQWEFSWVQHRMRAPYLAYLWYLSLKKVSPGPVMLILVRRPETQIVYRQVSSRL